KRLNLNIRASEVPKITSKDNPYQWVVTLPEGERLFQQHLSKLSVGPLIQLCKGVGTIFYAQHRDLRESLQAAHPISFNEDLNRFNSEKELLTQQVRDWQCRVEKAEQRLDELGKVIIQMRENITQQQKIINKSRYVMMTFIRDNARQRTF
ncbi:hypothetical protein BX600DRAFT_469986, partial [Xylariales sp. PMI_506]